MRKLLLNHPSGSSAEIYLNGAQVTSWVPAMERERLFLSSNAVLEPGKSIRGGIPVVFPQFADSGPLPKHGWLRTSEWAVEKEEPTAVTLRIEETPQSMSIWPHTYEAGLDVSLEENALEVTLTVRNPGAEALTFTGALHSYLGVSDITKASVLGLYGLPYIDKTANRSVVHDDREAVTIERETDRIYTGAPRMVELSEGSSSVRISMTGFPDTVIWNPWADLARKIADMQPHDYMRFICIEAAAANQPIVLKAGETWKGTQRLEATR
jgi:glucose-6-phosphate 1-epimerase